MKKVTLGNTSEQISCLGLGTMYFGSKVDEKSSFQILDYYFDLGGRFLDSANKYASWVPGFFGGESENLLGKWMKERGNRQQLVVSSKVGFPYGEIPRSLKKKIMVSECEKSLKRLGVETIDLYFAHAFDRDTPLEESMEAFAQLKKQGKIRYAAASNFQTWQLADANAIASDQNWEGFVCIQQRHTYIEPVLRADFGTQLVLTPEMENFCAEKEISIMAYSPLLGGAYSSESRPVPIQYQTLTNDYRIKQLNAMAEELGVSPNAVVLAWMIQSNPSVIPLVTGSSRTQLEENLQVLTIKLSREQMKKLDKHLSQQNIY